MSLSCSSSCIFRSYSAFIVLILCWAAAIWSSRWCFSPSKTLLRSATSAFLARSDLMLSILSWSLERASASIVFPASLRYKSTLLAKTESSIVDARAMSCVEPSSSSSLIFSWISLSQISTLVLTHIAIRGLSTLTIAIESACCSVNDLALNPFRIFENSCSFLLKSSLKSLPVMILQRIGFSSWVRRSM